MHGIILNELKNFVTDTFDETVWHDVCDGAEIDQRMFVPVTTYPDEIVLQLVESATAVSGKDAGELLRPFGRYIVPRLVDTYGVHIDDDWTGLDLISNVEESIHVALRTKVSADFQPPAIDATRVDEDTVVVGYGSDRQLCDVAKGIIDGVGDHYDEEYSVVERECMHDGAERCDIVVTRAGADHDGDVAVTDSHLTDGGRTYEGPDEQ